MAVESQSGPAMAALIFLVTYAYPLRIVPSDVGCSLASLAGTIQETDGSVPVRAARR